MGQAQTPVVLHMKQFGNQNQYQKKRETVFCYLDMMQTNHLQHLVYHNTPTWLIKFYDRQYQMLYISLKICHENRCHYRLISVSYRSRGEEHGWLNALI